MCSKPSETVADKKSRKQSNEFNHNQTQFTELGTQFVNCNFPIQFNVYFINWILFVAITSVTHNGANLLYKKKLKDQPIKFLSLNWIDVPIRWASNYIKLKKEHNFLNDIIYVSI